MLNRIIHGEDGATPVLIVHGLYGSARNWGVIAKRLSDRGRVVAVDQRNHGQSEWVTPHTYAGMAADLVEVIRAEGGQMDVVGHSMGGKAAMMLALTEPELIRKLIVADIAPVTYAHSQIEHIERMRAVDLGKVTRRSDAEAQLQALGCSPALCAFFTQSLDVKKKCWILNLDVLARDMDEILGFPPMHTQFTGPTLFLSGAESDYVSSEHRSEIKRLFPGARFAKIPGAGHWLHAEKPREFEGSVRAFLGDR
ncbi:MAG: alpha/beta fold hydrolase [Pseudomonadota bacterium]